MLGIRKLEVGKLVSWKLGKVDTAVCHGVPELWRGPRRSGTRGAGGALRGAKRRAAVRASEAEHFAHVTRAPSSLAAVAVSRHR